MDTRLESASTTTTTRLFPEATWLAISKDLGSAFGMEEEELEAFRKNKIAQLIGALPFLAGCEDAGRTAVAHLGTYLLSVRETKPYFNATARDSKTLLERLWLLGDFRGGDQKIIDRGLSLLALNMISDYRRDIEEDARLGKYNPIAAGDFDYKDTVMDLELGILKTPCPEMDEILDFAITPLMFWSA